MRTTVNQLKVRVGFSSWIGISEVAGSTLGRIYPYFR
jgi:hypothetical protein